MRRKYILPAIFAVSLIALIYWRSNTDIKNTILLITNSNRYLKNYDIQPSNETCQKNPYFLIIVTSYVGHVELRSAHRRAMPIELLKSFNAVRVFLLAKIPQNEKYITQDAIQNESSIFGDILQGSFIENYRNLTYKHLMGLQWASMNCNNASFILKVDDDIVFNLQKTYDLLKGLDNSKTFLLGYILNNTKPRRNTENKWYVTWQEYQRNYYPPYLSGWYYVTTPKVAEKLIQEAVYHEKFWIDDIFITGLLTETLGIGLQHLPNDYWLEYYELLECCLKDMVQKFIQCDYVVGPNGGRNNLIVEYNEAIKHCDSWRNCTRRSAEKPLKSTCIVNSERSIFSEGKAEIRYVGL